MKQQLHPTHTKISIRLGDAEQKRPKESPVIRVNNTLPLPSDEVAATKQMEMPKSTFFSKWKGKGKEGKQVAIEEVDLRSSQTMPAKSEQNTPNLKEAPNKQEIASVRSHSLTEEQYNGKTARDLHIEMNRLANEVGQMAKVQREKQEFENELRTYMQLYLRKLWGANPLIYDVLFMEYDVHPVNEAFQQKWGSLSALFHVYRHVQSFFPDQNETEQQIKLLQEHVRVWREKCREWEGKVVLLQEDLRLLEEEQNGWGTEKEQMQTTMLAYKKKLEEFQTAYIKRNEEFKEKGNAILEEARRAREEKEEALLQMEGMKKRCEELEGEVASWKEKTEKQIQTDDSNQKVSSYREKCSVLREEKKQIKTQYELLYQGLQTCHSVETLLAMPWLSENLRQELMALQEEMPAKQAESSVEKSNVVFGFEDKLFEMGQRELEKIQKVQQCKKWLIEKGYYVEEAGDQFADFYITEPATEKKAVVIYMEKPIKDESVYDVISTKYPHFALVFRNQNEKKISNRVLGRWLYRQEEAKKRQIEFSLNAEKDVQNRGLERLGGW